jgi:DNA-binding NarL/FixJ family response regulator
MMIRLLLVQDQPSMHQGLRMLLATEPELAVVAEAPNYKAALDLMTSLRPDVVLVDVEQSRLDGVAPCALHSICQQAPVIILSLHDDKHTRAQAEEAGVAKFVSKFVPADALLTAIRQVTQVPGSDLSGPARRANS